MKKQFLLILFLIVGLTAQAQQRSEDEMQEIALKALSVKTNNRTKMSACQPKIKTLMTSPELGIYGREGGGWVIVSGDSRTVGDILAYSNEGTFDWENAPESVKEWISDYQSQIQHIKSGENRSPGASKTRSITEEATPVVGPLLKTQWLQNAPFYYMYPTYRYFAENEADIDLNYSTGCTATAMAQILKYWEWPKRGTGKHTNSNCLSETVDFSQSVYDWDNMLDKYVYDSKKTEFVYNEDSIIIGRHIYGDWNEEQANAVAKLMYDCGVALNSIYYMDGTSTYFNYVRNAFTVYFGYSTDAQMFERNDYSDDWDELLRSELNGYRPILYGGNSGDNSGGHSFVCDGYDDQGYFHFNFGWGDGYDGYFLTAAVIPAPTENYSCNQHLLCGIHPAGENDKVVSQDGLYYAMIGENEVEFTGYDNTTIQDNIVIADNVTANGKSYDVTNIAYDVLFLDKAIKSLTIGNNIKSIGRWAFNESAIEGITIPSSVTELGYGAFLRCESLKTANIGDGLKTISENAFTLCTSLENVTLGKNVESIQTFAFAATALKEITLPSTLKEIGYGSFYDCQELESVVFNDGIETIDDFAFQSCNIKSVFIPSSVTNIGVAPFIYNDDLSLITVSDENKIYTDAHTNAIIHISDKKLVEGLDDTVIPDYITTIGESSLENLNFTSISLPASVQTIEAWAIANCPNLTSVVIGPKVEKIGDEAFAGNPELKEFTSLATTPPQCDQSGDGVFYNTPVEDATLYVPQGREFYYAFAKTWKDFGTRKEIDATSIATLDSRLMTHDSAIYNLAGQKVGNDYKGIVIQNGKKYLNR